MELVNALNQYSDYEDDDDEDDQQDYKLEKADNCDVKYDTDDPCKDQQVNSEGKSDHHRIFASHCWWSCDVL